MTLRYSHCKHAAILVLLHTGHVHQHVYEHWAWRGTGERVARKGYWPWSNDLHKDYRHHCHYDYITPNLKTWKYCSYSLDLWHNLATSDYSRHLKGLWLIKDYAISTSLPFLPPHSPPCPFTHFHPCHGAWPNTVRYWRRWPSKGSLAPRSPLTLHTSGSLLYWWLQSRYTDSWPSSLSAR